MKTKEERIVELLNSKGLTIREAFEEGAKFGYDLAMKWRDIKDAPIEKEIIVKRIVSGKEKISIGYLFNERLFIEEIVSARWIPISEIIGWRPIE